MKPVSLSKIRTLMPILLGALTFLVFSPTIQFGFINYDDPDYVFSNPWVQRGFSWSSVAWAFTQAHSSNWHPLTWLSHILDWQLFGAAPGGHHFVNVLFHTLNTILVFWVLQKMTKMFWRPLFVASLFGLHPAHVESVAWIAERKDLLSTFFGLLSIGAYVNYVQGKQSTTRERSSSSIFQYGLALLFFAAGLMSKPMLVTWPFVFLLLDVWPFHRFPQMTSNAKPATPPAVPVGRLLLEKAPFFALSLCSIATTLWAQNLAGSIQTSEQFPFGLRLQNAITAYALYLKKMVWPVDLAVFYPYLGPASFGVLMLALFILVIISVFAFLQLRTRPYLFCGWFWFIGTLIPVIGLVQVGDQALADRYTYIPFLGLFIVAAWLFGDLVHRKVNLKVTVLSLAGVATLCCAILSARQVRLWRNTAPLFEHAVHVTTNNFLAATVLATERMSEGQVKEARSLLDQAIKWKPHYAEAHLVLGNLLRDRGEAEPALNAYQNALKYNLKNSEAYNGYGITLLQVQRYEEAESAFKKSIELNPFSPRGYVNLGISLHRQRKFDEAIQAFQKSLQAAPNFAPAYINMAQSFIALGKNHDADLAFDHALQNDSRNSRLRFEYAAFLEQTGRGREALQRYEETIQLEPSSPDALNNMAWLLATSDDVTLRNGSAAVAAGEKAAALTQEKIPIILGTLAAAYAEAGRFEDAIAYANKAKNLAEVMKQPQVAQRNAQLLDLYSNKKTARDLPK